MQSANFVLNKTPTQALTPPAEKIGKSLTYVKASTQAGVNMRNHEK